MKKLNKIVKLSLGLLIIFTLFTVGFKIKEHFIGEKYIEYWKSNSNLYESVNQNESFNFKIFEKSALENDLVLFGEFHGTKQTIKIDVQFIKYLNDKVGMKTHIAEFDFSQAYFLNKYLKEGNDSIIQYVLNSWIIKHGHNNKSYNDKWREIHKLNKTITDRNLHIKVLGIDKIQDFKITQHHLLTLFKNLNVRHKIPRNEKEIIKWAKEDLATIIGNIKKDSSNQKWIEDVLFIQKNIVTFNNQSREDFMINNFTDLYKRYNLEGQKIYGYFGGAHVLQKEMNGKKDFGKLVVMSTLPLSKKTYSITTRYIDSYMSAPSAYLPPLIKKDTEHTKISNTCDNMALLYHYGINDLKSVTKKYSNTFFNINALNSPYKNSLRLIDNIGLYSLLAGMRVTDKESVTTDYIQAVILIRNSDWAVPTSFIE
ncbi:MAG: hypothetical protein JKY08_08490 [Flavobacteriaceae bacterium]|nr:hypothetical protein [Flavobacteriaceae bacterium]